MEYSPMTRYLLKVEERLKVLDIPIYFKLPDASVDEPFIVIHSPSAVMARTAQTGVLIEDASLLIHIFLPIHNRLLAEEVRSRAVRLLGRDLRMSTQLEVDNSIGREVYRVILRTEEIIF